MNDYKFIPPNITRKIVSKVMMYIFDEKYDSILVFTQPQFPEAGLQIPAGTIEAEESVEHAAARELQEETGLGNSVGLSYFAVTYFDMQEFKDEVHIRHWFTGVYKSETPNSSWIYLENQGEDLPDLEYSYSWIPIEEAHHLIAGHGHLADLAHSILLQSELEN
ncbi:NUDIX hydrolase [Rothia amarae]|uniref:NUDIX hydrolase n=1 Tax=Rothia amarae TaxID=169480 RepID=UPI0031D1121B